MIFGLPGSFLMRMLTSLQQCIGLLNRCMKKGPGLYVVGHGGHIKSGVIAGLGLHGFGRPEV